jgi:hypothetical protein
MRIGGYLPPEKIYPWGFRVEFRIFRMEKGIEMKQVSQFVSS